MKKKHNQPNSVCPREIRWLLLFAKLHNPSRLCICLTIVDLNITMYNKCKLFVMHDTFTPACFKSDKTRTKLKKNLTVKSRYISLK